MKDATVQRMLNLPELTNPSAEPLCDVGPHRSSASKLTKEALEVCDLMATTAGRGISSTEYRHRRRVAEFVAHQDRLHTIGNAGVLDAVLDLLPLVDWPVVEQ